MLSLLLASGAATSLFPSAARGRAPVVPAASPASGLNGGFGGRGRAGGLCAAPRGGSGPQGASFKACLEAMARR